MNTIEIVLVALMVAFAILNYLLVGKLHAQNEQLRDALDEVNEAFDNVTYANEVLEDYTAKLLQQLDVLQEHVGVMRTVIAGRNADATPIGGDDAVKQAAAARVA